MTTPMTQPTTTASSVDRFVEAIRTGALADLAARELLTEDCRLDATVPHWRFPLVGAEPVHAKLASWFDEPGTFEELNRHPFDGGEVVEYTFSSTQQGSPYVVHHVHILRVDPVDGRISSDRFWCGGRWGADLLAEMAEAAADAG